MRKNMRPFEIIGLIVLCCHGALALADGPIRITSGGTYSGSWQSTDPNTPAITISTAEPVTLQNCSVTSVGDLVVADVTHANITILHCYFVALNPMLANRTAGRIDIEYFDNVDIENNYFEQTGGVYLLNYTGNFSSENTVTILKNVIHNIDGRKSDGSGGYLPYYSQNCGGGSQDGYRIRQFLQLDKVKGVPRMEVAWNQVINEPINSRVEDNINIYLSGGRSGSPMFIHDNYIQGAYTVSPGQDNYSDGTCFYDWSYSGGGILLGDGGADDATRAPAYVIADSNQVVSTTNYGIAIAAGHDNQISNNRIVSSGYLSDGTWITQQNVGAYIWNQYGTGSGVFFNNSGHDNLVGWVNTREGGRNDWWMPSTTSWVSNVHLSGSISAATENDEYAYWQNKLSSSGISIGT